MSTPALPVLPLTWQNWIRTNLARGCDLRAMQEIMVRDGGIGPSVAQAALQEALAKPEPGAGSPALPGIDTSRNRLDCGDREVDVLFSLASPRLVLIGDFLSADECSQLCMYADDRLEPSPVVGDRDGTNEQHVHRSSRGAMLQRGESELVRRIEARIAALTRWPVDHGEGLQLLRYEKGNEYRPHYDWFDPARAGPARHLAQGGQRLATLIIYLSNVEAGGATTFPEAGVQIQPRRGHAVFFANTDLRGEPDPRALHAGEPVGTGIKLIATKWLRAHPYV